MIKIDDDDEPELKYIHGEEYEAALKDVVQLLEGEDKWWYQQHLGDNEGKIDYGTAWVVIYHLKKAIYQAMNNPPEGALE
jgi:hypothetical protein